MSTDVLTVSPELGMRDAFELLTARHLSGAPVVAGGRAVGVLSVTDLLDFAATNPPVPTERPDIPEQDGWEAPEEWEEGAEAPGAFYHELWADAGADALERFGRVEGPEWDALADHTVAEVMTQGPLCTVAPDAPVADAARRMLRAGVHRLLVLAGGSLVGIVTTSDIVRAVAEGRLGAAPAGEPGPHAARR
jgi:CBS domain-containing protein